uniref:Uncharacterized protein n=1 Tax=Anopheles culicifacies TaxID=139723 RepID=A0A182MTD4_9DIPT
MFATRATFPPDACIEDPTRTVKLEGVEPSVQHGCHYSIFHRFILLGKSNRLDHITEVPYTSHPCIHSRISSDSALVTPRDNSDQFTFRHERTTRILPACILSTMLVPGTKHLIGDSTVRLVGFVAFLLVHCRYVGSSQYIVGFGFA